MIDDCSYQETMQTMYRVRDSNSIAILEVPKPCISYFEFLTYSIHTKLCLVVLGRSSGILRTSV